MAKKKQKKKKFRIPRIPSVYDIRGIDADAMDATIKDIPKYTKEAIKEQAKPENMAMLAAETFFPYAKAGRGIKTAYKALKKLKQTLVGHKTGEDTLTFTDLKKIKNAARNIEDIYEDMVDTEMDEKEEKESKEVEKKNEQSEGHGKMYNALQGVREGKVVKINQGTLKRIVERVIKEQK